ncbi:butyrate kinase [Pelolinea submarina]|uniref:Probable butyrate kinase n=1 Tax=Pelolinea submarina TaxID=913107 RepID=A0A347ZWJ4_9CHLR|nr:butyrate kinase [Pelolinea submarina]REG05417.1 butyrate kinase [Pelolinea submarina]BBB49675.1 butyrate kinase [Pelolinea submarina]
MAQDKILVINPGSTSTKIALYTGSQPLWQENIEHLAAELSSFKAISEQLPMRLALVRETLQRKGLALDELAAIAARGGLLPPLAAGAYEVTPYMLEVLEKRPVNQHASNLAAGIAYAIAQPLGIKAYVYDPVTVDEMIELVRITGLKGIRRHGQGHNLNMRAAALRYCADKRIDYRQVNLIVTHLGGGITLSLHAHGRIIDMVSDDEGPFSPERAGALPNYKLLKQVFESGAAYPEIMKQLQRKGGLMSHFGTADVRAVQELANTGDAQAALVLEAMALSVAQSIARLAVDVNGQVDAIILTGGIAHSAEFTGSIEERIKFIAPVTIIPGENEMQALAEGVGRVLRGEETATVYKA